MVCEVKSGAKILPVYSPLNIKLSNNLNRETKKYFLKYGGHCIDDFQSIWY